MWNWLKRLLGFGTKVEEKKDDVYTTPVVEFAKDSKALIAVNTARRANNMPSMTGHEFLDQKREYYNSSYSNSGMSLTDFLLLNMIVNSGSHSTVPVSTPVDVPKTQAPVEVSTPASDVPAPVETPTFHEDRSTVTNNDSSSSSYSDNSSSSSYSDNSSSSSYSDSSSSSFDSGSFN